ncbi:hypothetical protein ACFL1Y_02050 [Patescibacteria group bacterium]
MLGFIEGLFHFRNSNHEFWFYLSVALLLVCIIAYLIFKHKQQFSHFIFMHSGISVIATIKVILLNQPDRSFSADCVWFNGLMATIYIILFFMAKKREQVS